MGFSQSNRRLTGLMAYQSWHRDILVEAICRIRRSDTDKFVSSLTTHNDGLGIEVRIGESKQWGHPLFDHGSGTYSYLTEVEARSFEHSHIADLTKVLDHIKTRPSERDGDAFSLTLTQTSNPNRCGGTY